MERSEFPPSPDTRHSLFSIHWALDCYKEEDWIIYIVLSCLAQTVGKIKTFLTLRLSNSSPLNLLPEAETGSKTKQV